MTLLAVVGWLAVIALLAPRIGRALRLPGPQEPTHADPGFRDSAMQVRTRSVPPAGRVLVAGGRPMTFRFPPKRGRRDDDRGGPRESRPASLYDREAWRRDVSGRAAGALLTGQRQDGLICTPAERSTPGRLTDARGVDRPEPGSAFDVKWPWCPWVPYERPADWSPLLTLFDSERNRP